MTVRIELTEHDDIAIFSEFRDKDLVKTVPGARWDPQERVWRAPLAWTTCLACRGVFGDRLEIGDRLRAWAFEIKSAIKDPGLALRHQLDDQAMMEFEPRLKHFQAAGVRMISIVQRMILADEMGSGKTVQASVAARLLRPLPLLIVCPKVMKRVWKRELAVWAPDFRVVICEGGAAARRDQISSVRDGQHDVLIVGWETLRMHTRLAGYGSMSLTDQEKEPKELNDIKWAGIIADEAHRMKEPKAKMTRACWWLADQPGCNFKLAMTGTPIGNHPGDLWSLLRFIDKTEWSAKTRYIDRYCATAFNIHGGLEIYGLKPEHIEEFQAGVDPHLRRMPKKVTLTELPPIRGGLSDPAGPQIRYAEMQPKQARAYKSMLKEQFAVVDGGTVIAGNPIAQLTRLMQFASATGSVNQDGEVELQEPSCKVDALLEVMDEYKDEPVVVFSQSRQLLNLVAQRFDKDSISYRMIVGGQSDLERDNAINDFQDGRVNAILVTIAAGGVGVTLTRSRVAVFINRDYNMINNVQAEARVHRIGSEIHDDVQIIDIVAENTVDEGVLMALADKGEKLQEIVRDAEALKRFLKGT